MSRLGKIAGGLATLTVVGLLGAGLWGYRAARHVPEFYRQALARPAENPRAASDDMLRQATAAVSQAQRPGLWESTFTAEQINGWLAVDLVENHAQSLPPGFSEPRVSIEPGNAAVAVRWQNGNWQSVLWLDCDLYVTDPNTLAIRVKNARAGKLPIPMERILEAVDEAAGKWGAGVRWQKSDGHPLALVTIPPIEAEGGNEVWIESIELGDQSVRLTGRTTPPGVGPPSKNDGLQTADAAASEGATEPQTQR